MNIKAATQAAWKKSLTVKQTGALNHKDIFKRPVLLGFAGLVLLTLLTSVGYVYHQRNIKYMNTSLRDSCQVSELYIGVRGSGETSDQVAGLGVPVGDTEHKFSADMQPTQIAGVAVDYEAVAMDPRVVSMYDQSWGQGVQQLFNTLYYWNHHCPNYRFVIAGYSQGADVVGQVMATLNRSNPTELQISNKIDGVALFGDPKYNPGLYSVNANGAATKGGVLTAIHYSNHSGYRSAFPSYLNGRVRSWCRTNDPVCQVRGECVIFSNAPSAQTGGACVAGILESVNQHTAYVSGGQTADAAAWLADRARHPSTPPIAPTPPPTPPRNSTPAPTPGPASKNVYRAPSPAQPPKIVAPKITYTTPNPPKPNPTPTPNNTPPPNRVAVTSYDRMQPSAPHHGYFNEAWQNFVAQSNTITYLSATVGNPVLAAGGQTGIPLTLRLCTTSNCSNILAEISPGIVNYGETGGDIDDVPVTKGATYYIEWYQPAWVNGSSWVTYWWSGGSTITTSDQLQAVARGYNK